MAAAAASRPAYAPPSSSSNAPAGTFPPGTKVQVGSHRVVIERYLSEGGFAHVYVVRLPAPDNGTAVLKRVAVPDKDALASMRTEVETMKKLKGHAHIVTYIDSHASQLKGGGYEVFLLMEYCQGGGLIDFMNTRLKNRLTEPEILEIFQDSAEGIATMHYLKPPLLHRDLKIENILISTSPTRTYKLCDFGSSAPPRPPANNAAEGRLIEEDIQKNTTLQYRCPEMIDVYRRRPIDEKSDIWALGVFLYKLCYYTTPFEEQGQMAILTASFKYPAYPQFSDRLKRLIALMLMEDANRRPNIYQVLKEVCSMRGKTVPIKDIYADRTRSEARNMQELPPREQNVKSPPMVGAAISAPDETPQYIPEVTPMRRGRPTGPTQPPAKPAASSQNSAGDPFAALDSKNYDERAKAVSELSNKFPSLDDFSLLQDKNAKFQFGKQQPPAKPADLSAKVVNALADEAFAKPSLPTRPETSSAIPAQAPPPNNEKPEVVKPKPLQVQNTEPPQKPPKPVMVSVGTMTSPRPSPVEKKAPAPLPSKPTASDRPIWRVPQLEGGTPRLGAIDRFDTLEHKRHSVVRDMSRSPNPEADKQAASSRPSLEGGRPIVKRESSDVHRSHSAHSIAGTPPAESTPPKRESFFRRHSHRASKHLSPEAAEVSLLNEPNIESNLDYLRAQEEEAHTRPSHHRSSSLHKSKHGSFGHLAGKVGETFRRFESGRSSSKQQRPESAFIDADADYVAKGSAVIPSDAVIDDDDRIDITEELSPEMRREFERRQLEQEERRVEEAAQAYRARVQANGTGSAAPSRASAIQSRVKNLLDESGRVSPVKRTAEGYGRFTTPSTPQDTGAGQPQAMPIRTQATDALPPRHGLVKPMPSAADDPIATLPQRSSSIAVGAVQRATEKAVAPRPAAKPAGLKTPTIPQMPHVPSAAKAPPEGADDADWETTFSKRYPRLSLELVEADSNGEEPIGRRAAKPLRVRDV